MKPMDGGVELYAYGVVAGGQVKMDHILMVNYRDLTLVGKPVKIPDFQKQLQEALKNPKAMEGVLTEHQGMLDELITKTTVIPFQFGTILKHKQAAADHLKSGYAKYQELLNKFKARQEWGVRVFADLNKFRAGIIPTNQARTPKSRSGTGYLLRKKQEQAADTAANEKLSLFSAQIFAGLKKLAFESKVTKSSQRFSDRGEPLISVFAFLVDKSQIGKFSQKFKSQQKKYQKFGLSLTISGPWPAYNFVN
jgi:hypothetical protein